MRIFLVLLLLSFGLDGKEPLYLKDRLKLAEKGDFVVMEQHNNLNILLIKEKNGSLMTVEEIVVPSCNFKPIGRAFVEWVNKKALGNTSWVALKIDLDKGKVEKMYSYTTKCFYDMSNEGGAFFLTTLLNVPFQEIPLPFCKKIGYPPKKGEKDTRRLWFPQVVYQSKKVLDVYLQPYSTFWPNDKSPLAQKEIEAYFVEGKNSDAPLYFPVYIDVKGILHKGKLRLIDSGKNMRSPLILPPQF